MWFCLNFITGSWIILELFYAFLNFNKVWISLSWLSAMFNKLIFSVFLWQPIPNPVVMLVIGLFMTTTDDHFYLGCHGNFLWIRVLMCADNRDNENQTFSFLRGLENTKANSKNALVFNLKRLSVLIKISRRFRDLSLWSYFRSWLLVFVDSYFCFLL